MSYFQIIIDVLTYTIGFGTMILGIMVFLRVREKSLFYFTKFLVGNFLLNIYYLFDSLDQFAKIPTSFWGQHLILNGVFNVFYYVGIGFIIYFGLLFICEAAARKISMRIKILIISAILLYSIQDILWSYYEEVFDKKFIFIWYQQFCQFFLIGCALGFVYIIVRYYQRIHPPDVKLLIKIFGVICLLVVPLEVISNYYSDSWAKHIPFSPYFISNSLFYLLFSLVSIKYLVKQLFTSMGTAPSIINTSLIEKYGISEREHEIILLAVKGYSYQEIAAKLYISVATVKTHLHHIYFKTGAKNRTELIYKLNRTEEHLTVKKAQ